ncbi:MAG TPA: hypothetical protein VM657_00850 [Sphingomonas sp.]|nr:hypothetical protein [Sphingomonas sp.]
MPAPAFLTGTVVMGSTAAASAIAAVYVITRPVETERGVYARRMVGTMLGALALILGVFCIALNSLEGG